ncbi:MAG: TIGR02147 family protein [Bdellovibrio sp.]|nr:TIGR02147 family protein [Bdellovibrio sp.]
MKADPNFIPSLFQYLSITKYLEDLYLFKKKQNPGFSFDSWASDLGFKSRSFIRMIITGERNITLQFIDVFSQSMNYSAEEKIFFSLLANYSQCENEDEKKYYQDRLFEIQGQQKELVEIIHYTEFLSSKLLPQLLVLLSFTDIDRTDIGLSLLLEIPLAQIQNDLQSLEKMQLITQENGIWIPTKKSFKVQKNANCDALLNCRNNSLTEAIDAQSLPAEQRRYRSILLPLAQADYDNLLQDIESLISKAVAKYDSETLGQKKLYKMNINVIPTLHTDGLNGPGLKPEHATRLLEI